MSLAPRRATSLLRERAVMAARPTLAVGARRASGDPILMGSAILWDIDTGLSTTDAHVILDCGTSNSTLDPQTHGVALGVGSADADIVWLWTALS